MAITVERISYKGWDNCYRIGNGQMEVVVTTDVGPRIIRCGFIGKPNLFHEFPEQLGKTGAGEWQLYGGHRLWHSPEALNRTYWPDNIPVRAEILPDGIHLCQPTEPTTGIEKELLINMAADRNQVRIEHRLTNNNCWALTFAPWAISVMKAGGTAIIPQNREPVGEGLLPNRIMALWPYSDMNDPRVHWGSRYIRVTQDPAREPAFKFGLSVPEGWLAYQHPDGLFVKKFPYQSDDTYPDGGVNAEIYTNNFFLEVESLGVLQTVVPGDQVTHIETWSIYQNIPQLVEESKISQFFAENICNFF